MDPKVRPPFHHGPGWVRAHVLLCMLTYHVEWRMRERLWPLLFDDDPDAALRGSPLASAQVSESAVRKASRGRTADGLPIYSLRTLLDDLATVVRNRAVPRIRGAKPFRITTRPTPLQQRAFDLLGIRLERVR